MNINIVREAIWNLAKELDCPEEGIINMLWENGLIDDTREILDWNQHKKQDWLDWVGWNEK